MAGGIAAAVGIGSKLIESAPGIISAGQQATEMRKNGKQQRKHNDEDFKRKKAQEDYYSSLEKNAHAEQSNKQELAEHSEGTSLLGRWTNESRDYNKYKSNVEADLRSGGHITTEKYKEGKGKNAKEKSREVYSADIDNQRASLYKKYTGYDMTTDHNNKLIGGQSWADVDKNDEAIIAGEREKKKAYGVSGRNAGVNDRRAWYR